MCRDFNYLIFISILIQPDILKCAKYLLFPDLEFQILPGCSCCANCYWVSSLKRLFLEFGMGFSFPFGDTSIALKHLSPFVPARTDSAARGFSLWGLKKPKPFHLFGVSFSFFQEEKTQQKKKKIIKRKWKVGSDWVSGENIFLALK